MKTLLSNWIERNWEVQFLQPFYDEIQYNTKVDLSLVLEDLQISSLHSKNHILFEYSKILGDKINKSSENVIILIKWIWELVDAVQWDIWFFSNEQKHLYNILLSELFW